MKHKHSVFKRLEGGLVVECICNARKVVIPGIATKWVEGSYVKRWEEK